MSLNRCAHCTTLFSIGAEHCPQCGNADFYEEGSMPKITRHGGATYAGDVPADAPAADAPESVEEFATEEPEPETVSPYDGMLREELKTELDRRGLPTSGNKTELVARLAAADELDVTETVESDAEDAE